MFMTWAIGRLLVGDKVRYLGMANILLDRDVYPEYLQKEATPENLAARLSACFDNPEILKTMMRDRDDLLELLRPRAGTPDAAEWILSKLEEKPVK